MDYVDQCADGKGANWSTFSFAFDQTNNRKFSRYTYVDMGTIETTVFWHILNYDGVETDSIGLARLMQMDLKLGTW